MADTVALLESLRWKEDMLINNHEGERVWLKPCFNGANQRIGVTDCCHEAEPCERHKALAASMPLPQGDVNG